MVKGEDEESVREQLLENARRLYKIQKPYSIPKLS